MFRVLVPLLLLGIKFQHTFVSFFRKSQKNGSTEHVNFAVSQKNISLTSELNTSFSYFCHTSSTLGMSDKIGGFLH